MQEPTRLTREELRTYFGIEVPPELTKDDRRECASINALFDAVTHERGMRERAVFEHAYPHDRIRAHKALYAFLKDVRTCPNVVRTAAQQLLNSR